MNVIITPRAIYVPGPTVTDIGTLYLPATTPVATPPVPDDDVCPDCGADMTDCCSDPTCARYFCESCEFGTGI